jgi:predicted homoserine dehydrogenase-like protein
MGVIMYYDRLRQLEKDGRKIRILLVGAGSMGVGIAWQIAHTPGMELICIVDTNPEAAVNAARAYGAAYEMAAPSGPFPKRDAVLVTTDPFALIRREHGLQLDVLIESTNTIGFACELCLRALHEGLDVILMNAEVDLATGWLLHEKALEQGRVITSDAGDQHGVLMRMIEEIRMWGFDIVMAGNIKGYLDRYATADSIREEARKRNLNPIQCAAYTDGTKLNIEMALIGNGVGLVPWCPGMEGPPASDVHEVFSLFDFSRYGNLGVVDYIVGSKPNGGVFVIGRCDDPIQVPYLKYYKLGEGPNYLFYRPYHLCHLETPCAVAAAVLDKQSILWPRFGRLNDVYAYAKRDITAGEKITQGIGGETFYGLIDKCSDADANGCVPITLLEGEGKRVPRLKRTLRKDQALTIKDIELPETFLLQAFRDQEKMINSKPGRIHYG